MLDTIQLLCVIWTRNPWIFEFNSEKSIKKIGQRAKILVKEMYFFTSCSFSKQFNNIWLYEKRVAIGETMVMADKHKICCE